MPAGHTRHFAKAAHTRFRADPRAVPLPGCDSLTTTNQAVTVSTLAQRAKVSRSWP